MEDFLETQQSFNRKLQQWIEFLNSFLNQFNVTISFAQKY